MKYTLFYLAVSSVFSTLSAQNGGSLAVLDLDARGISAVEASSLTDRLRSELVKTDLVTIVERAAMEQILQEQDFQMFGCTSDECAVEVGQLLGVTQMLAGSIGKVGSTYSIDLRLVDVQTGQIVKSITHDYRGAIDDLLGQMRSLARQLVGIEEIAEPSNTSSTPENITPSQNSDGSERSSPVVRWLMLGAIAVGGTYLALDYLGAESPPNPLVGLPPKLLEEPL